MTWKEFMIGLFVMYLLCSKENALLRFLLKWCGELWWIIGTQLFVNGKRYGFFHSTRELKQGGPLSLELFILGSKVLSRSLNRLHNHPDYHVFFIEMRGPQVNHLSFIDYLNLLTSWRCKTLKILIKTLK